MLALHVDNAYYIIYPHRIIHFLAAGRLSEERLQEEACSVRLAYDLPD